MGVNKWREATLLCGPDLDTSFTQGKGAGADHKKKKKKNTWLYKYHIYIRVCVCKTKVIKESNLDMPIA